MSGRSWGWIAAALALAAAVHLATVVFLPHIVMARVMGSIARGGMDESRAATARVNVMLHGRRPDARARGVVRPAPDLLYSTCVFDLDAGGGGVRVRAHGMPHGYWSISLFDADTNNFYVIDDRQAGAGGTDFIIVGDDWEKPMPDRLVRSPTRRGLVLVRTLIDDDAHLAAIDAARRHATCAPYRAR